MDDIAIKVDKVAKDFLLLHDKATTIKSLFTSFYKRRRKSRDILHALKDVSLEVKQGEFFGIVGRNGSGKSTLLKMLAGIYQPTSGSIRVNGKLVPFIELGVGFNPELTGRENVYLNGAMMGFSKKETGSMYKDIVEFAELEDFMDQKLKNYSSGMQVRLAFSVAIKAQADVLLVDEVLAVGDSAFQRKCYNYFKSLKRDKKTVVFVSHDMSAIREYCDRVALIEASRVKDVGSPIKIAGKYERLFVEDLSKEAGFITEDRWGNGAVKATGLHLAKNTLTDKDEFLELTVTLKANKKVMNSKSFMTGFRILNTAGQCVNEANTWNRGLKMPKLEAGQSFRVIWRCPNIYAAGKYSVGVFTNVDDETADSWDGGLYFQVNKEEHKGVLTLPEVEVTLRE